MPTFPSVGAPGLDVTQAPNDWASDLTEAWNVSHDVNGHVVATRLTGGLHFDVRAYGALGDGSSDDTSAIQAAINAAKAAGSGEVFFPPASYVVNGTLSVKDCDNILLRGVGAAHAIYSGPVTTGTYLKRTSGTGTMIDMGCTASSTEVRKGLSIVGMTIDGNALATTGIKLTSCYGGTFRDIHVRNCTTVNFETTTIDLAGLEDTQHNVFELISIRAIDGAGGSGIGMRCTSGAPGLGNTSGNNFHSILIYHKDGDGLYLGDADTNRFLGVTVNQSGGAGNGIVFGNANAGGSGHARDNLMIDTETAGPILAKGGAVTNPSIRNKIHRTSGSTVGTLTIEANATLTIHTQENEHFGTNAYGADYKAGTWSSAAVRLGNNTAIKFRKADDSSDQFLVSSNSSNEVVLGATGQQGVRVGGSQSFSFGEGTNIGFGTTTGTKIGNVGGAAGQKMAFWNSTPIVQPLLATGTGKTVDDVITTLQNLGLVRQT